MSVLLCLRGQRGNDGFDYFVSNQSARRRAEPLAVVNVHVRFRIFNRLPPLIRHLSECMEYSRAIMLRRALIQ